MVQISKSGLRFLRQTPRESLKPDVVFDQYEPGMPSPAGALRRRASGADAVGLRGWSEQAAVARTAAPTIHLSVRIGVPTAEGEETNRGPAWTGGTCLRLGSGFGLESEG